MQSCWTGRTRLQGRKGAFGRILAIGSRPRGTHRRRRAYRVGGLASWGRVSSRDMISAQSAKRVIGNLHSLEIFPRFGSLEGSWLDPTPRRSTGGFTDDASSVHGSSQARSPLDAASRRTCAAYPSDLTDPQWARSSFMPPETGAGRPRHHRPSRGRQRHPLPAPRGLPLARPAPRLPPTRHGP